MILQIYRGWGWYLYRSLAFSARTTAINWSTFPLTTLGPAQVLSGDVHGAPPHWTAVACGKGAASEYCARGALPGKLKLPANGKTCTGTVTSA